jgi:ABC-2 type transport system permease protein
MIALLRTEWAKTLRRPRTYVALGFVVVIPTIVGLLLWSSPPEPGDGPRFLFAATQTGLLFPAAALTVMSPFLLIVVISLFAGDAIAGESNTGNLRYLLVRPIGRGRLLTAKLVIALSLALIATVLLAATAMVVGGLAFGFEPLNLPPFFEPQSVGSLLLHTAIAAGYVTWSLASVVTFGFMVSTMTASPAGAAGSAVGFAVTSQILNQIESLGAVRDVLPLRYFDEWDTLFWSDHLPGDFWNGLLLPIPYAVGFCAVAWWWFRRKDIVD